MEKEKLLSGKGNRDICIATVFVMFILCVPAATLLSGFLPQEGKAGQESAVQKTSREESWFEAVQGGIRRFTADLFLKGEMIDFNRNLTRRLTGNRYMESTLVLLGKENWLFYKAKGDGEPLEDYMGTNHFPEEELQTIAGNLTAMRDVLEQERGIRFVAMGIPNKENMYPEYMPDTVPKLNQTSKADQLAEYLRENTDVTYVYLKEALLKAKEDYEIYYKTDTHWNQIGAFVGLQAFFAQVYGTCAAPESVSFEVSGGYAGDLATVARLKDSWCIDTLYTFRVETADPAQHRDEVLLIIGDSFSNYLKDIAGPYYEKVYRVTAAEFTMSMLDRYRPDIVLWELVERKMEIFEQSRLLTQ